MSVGEGSSTGFSTMRGRSYPALRQFTVFLENRVGQLLEVIRRFEGSRVRIVALSISDAAECAFVRFLLSHPEQGRELLERAGLPALLQAEINLIQAYPLFIRRNGNPVVALMVVNIETALETLRSEGLQTISESDLIEDD